MSKLSLVTEYENNLSLFEQNRERNWNEWLEFSTTFKKPGKQGLVGIMNSKTNEKIKYVFKISQYLNYLVEHEYSVMKGLTELGNYCPHYCKSYGILECDIDPSKRKSGNPFKKIDKKYMIQKKVLLMEYIENSVKFCTFIKNEKIGEDILLSTIKQVLLATVISQKVKKFSHYDLHSDNIMMKKCSKDLVFLYVLGKEDQFLVPTLGEYPVIIDFGFSYIEDMNNDYLWPSMGHTDVGFMSDRFDWVADPKLFLISVSNEIKEERRSKNSKKLCNVVKNIFYPLSVEWDCGWDNLTKSAASDYVGELLEESDIKSHLFKEYEHYCIDMIQSLIILPFEPKSTDNINISFETFIKEFYKIERQIGNDFYNLYILKGIVDSARIVRADYYHSDTRKEALKKFRIDIYEKIEQVAKFCKTKDVDFEKMLCSLLVLSKCIEGVYYDVVNKQMENKKKEYSKLPLKSVEEIYGCIEVNFPDKYVYNENTIIFCLDCTKKVCKPFRLSKKEIKELNEIHPLTRGGFLYQEKEKN
jgi:hypothetical protein